MSKTWREQHHENLNADSFGANALENLLFFAVIAGILSAFVGAVFLLVFLISTFKWWALLFIVSGILSIWIGIVLGYTFKTYTQAKGDVEL